MGPGASLALLPAAGNFAGGLAAEFVPVSRRTLSLALHVAAGIVLGVIALELAPRAFAGDGAVYLAVDAVVERFSGGREGGEPGGSSDAVRGANRSAGAWMIYMAVAVDLFSGGLLIGAGSSLSFGLALLLAVGQVTADLPEGFATVANFKDKGVPRVRRLLLAASFLVPVLTGAMLAYFVLRGLGEAVQLTALAFIAGMLLVAAAEELIGEAHQAAGKSKGLSFGIVGRVYRLRAGGLVFRSLSGRSGAR